VARRIRGARSSTGPSPSSRSAANGPEVARVRDAAPMKKGTLWVFRRPGASATVHWVRSCRRARSAPQGSRMIPLDAEWQQIENLTDAPPSTVVARAQEMFAARVCVECVPESVLERLGLQKPRAASEAPAAPSTTPASVKEVALYTEGHVRSTQAPAAGPRSSSTKAPSESSPAAKRRPRAAAWSCVP
jgi:hypothetical protein